MQGVLPGPARGHVHGPAPRGLVSRPGSARRLGGRSGRRGRSGRARRAPRSSATGRAPDSVVRIADHALALIVGRRRSTRSPISRAHNLPRQDSESAKRFKTRSAPTSSKREPAHGIRPLRPHPGRAARGRERTSVADAGAGRDRRLPRRLSSAVEATAYSIVADALTNVDKRARAGHAEVTAQIEDGTPAVQVRDDGVAGARPDGAVSWDSRTASPPSTAGFGSRARPTQWSVASHDYARLR